ncbi:hypothetical protein LSH36_17g13000 [Paralvinella palmiformis]|uniref:Alpha-mannosidase n=1 Tax=Paralvinella palmiformis TaxID=53620 RepID=A0AAD9NH54_9ANNE|nr:hypothetical protein LSH36_17g13000 [Paralvinella palmiformis]
MILERMKFSYRITTLSLLFATMIVLYLSWGDDYMMWNRKANASSKIQPGMSLFQSTPLTGDFRAGQCWDWSRRRSANVTYDTHNILHLINDELGVHTNSIRLPPEGQPIPTDKMKPNYKKPPLKIILVPHSHNDPGWHKTVFGYFQDQTKPTLDNMVNKLIKYPNMTFIWAESIFLHMWYQDSSPHTQAQLKKLIKRGQLEIVSGSWIVPDEANPHYFALVDQMIEGHRWLERNLDIKPQNTWSLDPFGYSATHPYLYQRAGYENMVILRVHERVKVHLEEHMSLEFFWRQNWDSESVTDIFTQLMPYMLYNIKHTCGPDHAICLQYDFRNIPGEVSESRSVPITELNVENLSRQLLEQYRKKATLFRHNVLLIPLGDDFRYDRDIEWDQQYTNYEKLFNYINSRKDWNVEARFGTLKDYFAEVRHTLAPFDLPMEKMFPSVSGDFYPYTDQRQEYWAGYFTSRPYDKVMGRELEVWLRAAEILNTLAAAAGGTRYMELQGNMQLLEMSRRSLALFQHHDAITGTARHFVTTDFEQRLTKGLEHAQDIIKSASRCLLNDGVRRQKELVVIDVEEPLSQRMLKPHINKYNVPKGGLRLAIFNPLAHHQDELVTITVASHAVVVRHSGQYLPCQINPIWSGPLQSSSHEYQLVFRIKLAPLAIGMITLLPSYIAARHACKIANISVYNTYEKHIPARSTPFNIVQGGRSGIKLKNEVLELKFSGLSGYLESIKRKSDKKTTLTRIQFLVYKSLGSGAYIFKPEGPASLGLLNRTPLVRVIHGPLLSEVQTIQPAVNHTVRLLHTTGLQARAVHIENIVDVREFDNQELIMRINSSIKNNDEHFYTDLNGFQVMQRKRFKNFPIEANYYPSMTFLYLEDEMSRMSLLSSQSLGASSQGIGSLEVMLDRRLRYDDGRGLGEGVTDNRRTPSRFYLLIEDTGVASSNWTHSNHNHFSLPSLEAHLLTESLRYYPVVISLGFGHSVDVYQPLARPLPCDVTLVNLRSLDIPDKGVVSAALILHRVGYDCLITRQMESEICSINPPDGSIILQAIFNKTINLLSAKECTLSLMYDKSKIDLLKPEILQPMHLYTYRLLLE